MTLLFSNNTFKYEIEAIVKLFIPATTFNFVYEQRDAEDDIIMTRIRKGKIFTYLYAYVRINGTKKRLSHKILNTDQNYNDSSEFGLCTLVFKCIKELTGVSPQWGLITGIRPVKKVNALIEAGLSKDEVFQQMGNKYLISPKKLELAYATASIQLPLLKNLNPKAISLYISIPFCPTRCSYCSFVSHSMDTAQKLIPDYLKFLYRELEILGKIVKDLGVTIDTVYFGGGTPTTLEASQLEYIMAQVQNCFDLSKIREYNVEAGRPDTITPEKLAVIKKMGADRISINPQTLNDEVLEVIGRKHSTAQTFSAFEMARNTGFENINMDLIAGLPTDTPESFKNTLDGVLALNPDSITVHTLTLKRSATLYSQGKAQIKNPVEVMVDYAQQNLMNNAYMPYYLYRQKNTVENLENVGYAKKDKESLYNIFIMDEIQTILGAGCAASTKLVSTTGKIKRVHNYKFPYEYINRFDELMDKKTEIYQFYKDYFKI